MRWRVLTALALILGILAGGVICRRAVGEHCRMVEDALLRAKAEPRRETLEQAGALWERWLPMLSCLLTHDRLERVGEGLARAAGFLEQGAQAELVAQIDALLYLLDDIREYDHVGLQTLL